MTRRHDEVLPIDVQLPIDHAPCWPIALPGSSTAPHIQLRRRQRCDVLRCPIGRLLSLSGTFRDRRPGASGRLR
jgi:hypothetical protein